MSKTHIFIISVLAGLFLLFGTGCKTRQNCDPGASQACLCSDGSEAVQECRQDGSGWESCECITSYSYWNDPDTDLTWQDPQKDAYTDGSEAPGQPDAERYCEELVLGGYDDWRLPNIDELRTLIRGNPEAMADGDCPLHEGSKQADMYDPDCAAAEQYEGPGDGGCYWPDELTGPCNRQDFADEFNKPLETVSSTVAVDDNFWVACILFDRGSVSFNHIYSYADVRCVRDGPTDTVTCADGPAEKCVPGATQQCKISSVSGAASETTDGVQVCAANGKCWGPCEDTSFTPSPPIEDVSQTCDQIKLIISVPEKIETEMKLLVAFLFPAEDFTLPPSRPPDGGTDYNQVFNPVIDVDNPYEMTVPACSYYRDRCIDSGEYKLYIALLQNDGMPPWPQKGDYVWGYDQEPLTLQSGEQQIIEKEINLVAY